MSRDLLWVCGQYASVLSREFGGSMRSKHLMRVFADMGFRPVLVAYSKNRRGPRDDVFELRIRSSSKLLYYPMEALIRLGILDSRLPYRVSVLSPNPGDARLLADYASKMERPCIVLDGLPGASMFLRLQRHLRWGCIVYLSHNYEADYRLGGPLARSVTLKLEKRVVEVSDLIIAASIRDAARYRELGVDMGKTVVFPNVFPTEYTPMEKSPTLTAAIVASSLPRQRGYLKRLACFLARRGVRVLYVGRDEPQCSGVVGAGYIPGRDKYLSTLSQAHAGINYDILLGGSNVKRYDYALAGLAIFSGGTGMRGELLPGEAVYADPYDLIAKLESLGVEELERMGSKNRERAMELYRRALDRLKVMMESLA